MDLFVVKVEDVYRFKESDLFGFLDGQGYIDGSMEPHEDCQWVIVNFTNRIFDLGYPEALKDVHCVGNCILEKQDFYDIYNIFSKYDGLPPMTYDIDKAYQDEIERRLLEEEKHLDELVDYSSNEYVDIAEFCGSSDYADIDIYIQKNACKDEYIYKVEIEDYDINGGCSFCADFFENISINNIIFAYLQVDDLLKGNLPEKYCGLGWGRMELMLTNNIVPSRESFFDINIYLRWAPEYNGKGDYISFKLDGTELNKFRDFLREAYIKMKDSN